VIETENLTAVQQYWLNGRITNFEYLSYLNKMAGRSFNDLMQYPVLPFILAKYTGNTLDLDDSHSYRFVSSTTMCPVLIGLKDLGTISL